MAVRALMGRASEGDCRASPPVGCETGGGQHGSSPQHWMLRLLRGSKGTLGVVKWVWHGPEAFRRTFKRHHGVPLEHHHLLNMLSCGAHRRRWCNRPRQPWLSVRVAFTRGQVMPCLFQAFVVDHSASDPYGAERLVWSGFEKAGRGIVDLAKKTAPGIKARASAITQWAEQHVTRVEELMDRKKEQDFQDMRARMVEIPKLALDPQVRGLFTVFGDVKPTEPFPTATTKEAAREKRGVWGVPRGVTRIKPAADASASVNGDNSDRSVEEGQQIVRSDTPSSGSSGSSSTATTTTNTATTTTTTTITTSTDSDVAIKYNVNSIDSHATAAGSELSIIDNTQGPAIMANAMVTSATGAHVTTSVTDTTANDVIVAHAAEGTVAGADRVAGRGISHVTVSVRAIDIGHTRLASPVEAFMTEGSHHQALDRAITGSDKDEDDEVGAVLVITSTFTSFKQPPAALMRAKICTTTAVGITVCYAGDSFSFTTPHDLHLDQSVKILPTAAEGCAPSAHVESAAFKTCLGTTSSELMPPHLMTAHPPLLSDLAFASNAMVATAGSPPVNISSVDLATTATPSTAAPTASHDAVCTTNHSGQEHIDDVRNSVVDSSVDDTTSMRSTFNTADGSGQALQASTPSTDAQQVWPTQNDGSKLTTRERMPRHDLMFMADNACPQGYLCLRPKSMPGAQDIPPSEYLLFMVLNAEADNVVTPSPIKTTTNITAAAISDRCATMRTVARGLFSADTVAQVKTAMRDLATLSNVTINVTIPVLSADGQVWVARVHLSHWPPSTGTPPPRHRHQPAPAVHPVQPTRPPRSQQLPPHPLCPSAPLLQRQGTTSHRLWGHQLARGNR